MKNVIAFLLLVSATCAFLGLFRPDNTNTDIILCVTMMCVNALFCLLILKSK